MNYTSEFTEDELSRIHDQFKRLDGTHYLDHGGAAQYAENQLRQIFANLTANVYCNPHTSRNTEDLVDQVRYKILECFHTTTDEYSVIFTSGATAALKLLGENFNFGVENNGDFMYLRDNHTSVLGMREIVTTHNIKCVERSDFLSGAVRQTINNERQANNLLVFPAQCNFNGFKYPLDVVGDIQKNHSNTYVCVDAASFVATNDLNLTENPADYVSISFYKIFGYPTGLGALLVSKRGEKVLEKRYYGGGTVKIALSDDTGWHQKRDPLHERMEDGTISFLSIISLLNGYDTIQQLVPAQSIAASINRISLHCFNLCQYLFNQLSAMKYRNGRNVVQFYHDTDFTDVAQQGGVINFNVMHENGSHVGFGETSCMANIHNILLRTGCFCNPGACQRQLRLTNAEVKQHFQAGHICGDGNDLINGVPTGSVRVSVGYMTRKENVDALITMIEECYLKSSNTYRIKLEQTETQPQLILDRLIEPSSTSSMKKLQSTLLCANNEEVIEGEHIERKLLSRSADCKEIRLRQICVFPIKSCGPFRVTTHWPLTHKGLKYDREWMIVQSNGVVMTQKNDTKLCLIRPVIRVAENLLELHYPHATPVQVPLDINMNNKQMLSSMCQTKVCGDRVDGIDCGNEVADWLEDVLCISGLRLIKQNSSDKRTAKKKQGKDSDGERQSISLSNQAQYLLINMTSVDWLAEKVEEWDELDVFDVERFSNMVDRFRGNLIIETPDALEELDWQYVEIGGVLFKVDGHCTRCQMICIDQSTGEKTTEPLRTIAREFQGKMRFGLYMGRENNDGEVILQCEGDVRIFK